MICYCGGDKWAIAYRGRIRHGTGNREGVIRECMTCGVQRLTRALDPAIYNGNRYRELIGQPTWRHEDHHYTQKQNLDLVDCSLYGKTVLDVGSGGATFANMIAGMCHVYTLEPNTDYPADFRDLSEVDITFDAIFCFDVIEHVEDPLKFWQGCHRLLNPGGVMYTTTPNRDCFMMSLPAFKEFFYRTVHTWYFGLVSMLRLVELADVEMLSIETFERYGLANAFGWFDRKQPVGHLQSPLINKQMEAQWKAYLESKHIADNLLIKSRAKSAR